MSEAYAVRLIRALDACWTAIRTRHPLVPEVVLLPTPAIPNRRILGHFSALRWNGSRADTGDLHEVAVVAEHLDRSTEMVFETLLHEAAHALNFALGVKDCSTNQYHNHHFRKAAEKLGLAVERVEHYGWARTTLPDETADQYRLEIDALASVLIHRRGRTQSRKARRSRLLKAVCQCPLIIRASKTVLDCECIVCSRCGELFVEEVRNG
jgi:hypothetical protein